MNLLGKTAAGLLLLVAGTLSGVATATPITMDFDGLTPGTSVNRYYDGGCTKGIFFPVDCHGSDYGVVWKGATVGGSGGAHSGSGFTGLALDDNATMNVAAGFDGGLSFYYYNTSNRWFTGAVSVYSGKNGNGTLLSSLVLDPTNGWDFFDLTFSGVAKSVIFQGSPLFFTGFDDVTLGVSAPVNAVPEPGALGLFGLGVLLMGLFGSRRRRGSAE